MTTKRISKGITRHDVDGTVGFNVRITRSGKTHNKFFADSVHGGKRKAKKKAEAYYDSIAKKMGPVKSTRGLKHPNNTSGVAGVHAAIYVAANGEETTSWVASWQTDGKRFKIGFVETKYGKRKSKQLACIARELESNDRDKVVRAFERRAKSKKKRTKK